MLGCFTQTGVMMPRLLLRNRMIIPLAALLLASACGGAKPAPKPAPAPSPARTRASGAPATGAPVAASGPEFDGVKLYRELGLLARGAPMPFVGSVAFMASNSED